MHFDAKNITPRVWYGGTLWTVVQIIRGMTTYILVSRPHELLDADPGDGNKIFALIDTAEDSFYLDTPEVARLMRIKADAEAAFADVDVGVAVALSAIRVDMFEHDLSDRELEDLQEG